MNNGGTCYELLLIKKVYRFKQHVIGYDKSNLRDDSSGNLMNYNDFRLPDYIVMPAV